MKLALFIAGCIVGIIAYKIFKSVKEAWEEDMAIRNKAASYPRAKR